MLKFLQDFQMHIQRTRTFCQRVKEAGILEPMALRVKAPNGEKLALGGFQVVSRKKLRELPADKLAQLARTDELELLYLHLYSLRNLSDVKERLFGTVPAEGDDAGSGEAPASSAVH